MYLQKIFPQWVSFAIFSLILSFYSCEKDEGFGGTGSIHGTLILKSYDQDFNILQNEAPAIDEDVYIVFGDKEVIGENTATNFNGKFKFSYLRPGDYTIFYLSEDSLSSVKSDKEISINVHLEKGESIDLGTLYQYESVDFDDGAVDIKGRIEQINYVKAVGSDKITIVETVDARDMEVYITYGDDGFYSDKVDTQDDGSFTFSGLIKGDYRIFYYSDDTSGVSENVVYESTASVDGSSSSISLNDLTVYHRLDYDDGSAKIIGRIKQINYYKQSIYPNLIVEDTTMAQELEVYLLYGDGNFYEERIRTQGDGTFIFDNLVKGDYRIFFYSDDVSGGEAKVVVSANAKVSSDREVVDLGDLYIEEH